MNEPKKDISSDERIVDNSEIDASPDRIRFDYIKSSCFRVVHADGVVGGLTPRLDIHMDFWSERFPIPKQVVHKLNDDGSLGVEIKEDRDTRKAIIREVDVGVVLDIDNTKALRDWLNDRIAEFERIVRNREAETEGDA